MPLLAAGVASMPGSVAPLAATRVSAPSRRMRSTGARSTMSMLTVAGSCVVTTALSTQGSASTRLWMAAPLIVKMLSSGTSAAATTALVVTRRAPTTVTWRTWNAGRVKTSTSRATCTVERRDRDDAPPPRGTPACDGRRRRLPAACVAALARRGGEPACPRLTTSRRTGREESTISDACARTRATWRARSSSTSVLTRAGSVR